MNPKPNWGLKVLYGSLTALFVLTGIVTLNFWWVLAALFAWFMLSSDASNDYA